MTIRSIACSAFRTRYLVDVQSLSGVWQNVEICDTEESANRVAAEWRAWLVEQRKTWKDLRVVKETTYRETLPNAQDHGHLPAKKGAE